MYYFQSNKGLSSSKTTHSILISVISKIDLLQNDVNAIKKDVEAIKGHLISSVDDDIQNIDSLLPLGRKLDSAREVEDFQEAMDESLKRKLVRSTIGLFVVYPHRTKRDFKN